MKYTIFLLLTIHWLQCAGQTDSLINVFESLPRSEETVGIVFSELETRLHGDPEELENYGRYGLALSEEINYRYGQARSLNYIGISFDERGIYDQAMEYYLKAYELYISIDNTSNAATVAMNMGNIHGSLGQFEEATKSHRTALQFFKENDNIKMVSMCEMNLGVTFSLLGKLDSAYYYFEQVYQYRVEVRNHTGATLAKNNMAGVLELMGKSQASIEAYQEVHAMLNENQRGLLTDVYTGLGHNYLLQGNEQLGLLYLDSAKVLAKELDQGFVLEAIYQHLNEYYLSIRNFERAFETLKEEYRYNEQIRGEEVQKQVEVLELNYENEKKARELAQLEQEKIAQNFKLIMTFVAAISLVVLLILVVYIYRLKLKNGQLREKELKSELEQKNKELTSYALNFIQKNELMEELTVSINDLKKTSDTGTIHGLNKINRMVSDSFRIDQDWENFRMMFEEVHKDFFPMLKESYPDLGNAELKLCALLRLNLNLKESSRILGISPDSVKTARYRLRKKLNLTHEENLVDVLLAMEKDQLSVS